MMEMLLGAGATPSMLGMNPGEKEKEKRNGEMATGLDDYEAAFVLDTMLRYNKAARLQVKEELAQLAKEINYERAD